MIRKKKVKKKDITKQELIEKQEENSKHNAIIQSSKINQIHNNTENKMNVWGWRGRRKGKPPSALLLFWIEKNEAAM